MSGEFIDISALNKVVYRLENIFHILFPSPPHPASLRTTILRGERTSPLRWTFVANYMFVFLFAKISEQTTNIQVNSDNKQTNKQTQNKWTPRFVCEQMQSLLFGAEENSPSTPSVPFTHDFFMHFEMTFPWSLRMMFQLHKLESTIFHV